MMPCSCYGKGGMLDLDDYIEDGGRFGSCNFIPVSLNDSRMLYSDLFSLLDMICVFPTGGNFSVAF